MFSYNKCIVSSLKTAATAVRGYPEITLVKFWYNFDVGEYNFDDCSWEGILEMDRKYEVCENSVGVALLISVGVAQLNNVYEELKPGQTELTA